MPIDIRAFTVLKQKAAAKKLLPLMSIVLQTSVFFALSSPLPMIYWFELNGLDQESSEHGKKQFKDPLSTRLKL